MLIQYNNTKSRRDYQTGSNLFHGLSCPPGQWVVLEQGNETPVKKTVQTKMTDRERRGHEAGPAR